MRLRRAARRREEIAAAIAKAYRDCLRSAPIWELTVERVMESAGVQRSQFYLLYPHIYALVAEQYGIALDRIVLWITDRVQPLDGHSWAWVRRFVHGLVDLGVKDPEALFGGSALEWVHPVVNETVKHKRALYEQALASKLPEGKRYLAHTLAVTGRALLAQARADSRSDAVRAVEDVWVAMLECSRGCPIGRAQRKDPPRRKR